MATAWDLRVAARIETLPYIRGRDRLAQFLFTRASRRGTVNVTVANLELSLDLSDGVQQSIFCSRELPGIGETIASMLSPGMTVVDVGANIGWTTLFAARAVGPGGRVIAFEPGLRTHASLTRNVDLNGMDWVQPIRAACGSEATFATLYSAREASDYSSLKPCIRELTYGQEPCEVVRLDAWLAEHRENKVDLLKIDVEGAEWEVLRGMDSWFDSGARPTIVTELSTENMSRFGYTPNEMLAWLREFGYEPYLAEGAAVVPYEAGARVDHPTTDVVLRVAA